MSDIDDYLMYLDVESMLNDSVSMDINFIKFQDLWKDFLIDIKYKHKIPKNDLHNYRKYLNNE